jgi:hypothetical protein
LYVFVLCGRRPANSAVQVIQLHLQRTAFLDSASFGRKHNLNSSACFVSVFVVLSRNGYRPRAYCCGYRCQQGHWV